MSFWDRFILSVYQAFRPDAAHGLSAAARLFQLAHERGFVDPSSLNPLSLLLLAAACPRDRSLRRLTDQEIIDRGLLSSDAETVAFLRELLEWVTPARGLEALTLFHNGTPEQQGQFVFVIEDMFGPQLQVFLGRLFLTAPVHVNERMREIMAEALGRFSGCDLGTLEFTTYLFRCVPHAFHGAQPASRLPDRPLEWFASLSPEEQRLIKSCYRDLDAFGLRILYLSFYGHLDIRQLTQLLSIAKDSEGNDILKEDDIVNELSRCWDTVLRNM